MNNWINLPFEELYKEPSRNGLNRPKRVRGSGYRMVNMGELFACDRIRDLEMDLVPMNEVEKEKYSLIHGDLLFARQSLVAEGAGKCSIVLETPQLTTFESHLIRVRLNKRNTNPLFYYYYFVSPQGKSNVQSLVMQVAAAGIRGSELARLRIPFPPLPTQHKIASILSAYDDLIENNTRRIKILEEMAQRLYREWFVNFRFPNHENVKMVESELGLIPEGWEFTTIGDVCLVGDGAHASIKRQHQGIIYLTCKNFKNGNLDLIKVDYISEDDYHKYFKSSSKSLTKPKLGDILFSIIGTIGCKTSINAGSEKYGRDKDR